MKDSNTETSEVPDTLLEAKSGAVQEFDDLISGEAPESVGELQQESAHSDEDYSNVDEPVESPGCSLPEVDNPSDAALQELELNAADCTADSGSSLDRENPGVEFGSDGTLYIGVDAPPDPSAFEAGFASPHAAIEFGLDVQRGIEIKDALDQANTAGGGEVEGFDAVADWVLGLLSANEAANGNPREPSANEAACKDNPAGARSFEDWATVEYGRHPYTEVYQADMESPSDRESGSVERSAGARETSPNFQGEGGGAAGWHSEQPLPNLAPWTSPDGTVPARPENHPPHDHERNR